MRVLVARIYMNVEGEGALEVLLPQMACRSCGRWRAFGTVATVRPGSGVAVGCGGREIAAGMHAETIPSMLGK